MDIDLGDILHSQGLVTQIWISSCLSIKQITPTFLGKTFQEVKNPVGKFNKKLEFNLFCPQRVANIYLIGFQLWNIHLWPSVSLAITQPGVSPAEEICQGKYKLLMWEFLLREICAREKELEEKTHRKIAKGCPEYISSVVQLSSRSNQKDVFFTLCWILGFVEILFFKFS